MQGGEKWLGNDGEFFFREGDEGESGLRHF